MIEPDKRQFSENKKKSFFGKLNLVLSTRSLLLLFFLGVLFIFSVLEQSDIIAAVIIASFFAIIALLALITLYSGIKLKKKLLVDVFAPVSGELTEQNSNFDILSKKNDNFIVRTGKVNILPGFVLQIRIKFNDDGIKDFLHFINGSSKNERTLSQNIIFPHRGNWTITNIAFSFADKFGFTHYDWDKEVKNSFRVVPNVISSKNLPIISSASRSGDAISDIKEKNGDPYELKAYDPTDGMRKIVWKVYAKSGELITRHPESSVTPEGQSVIFCVANKKDEEVCGTALNYLSELEKLGIEIFFSCEGAGANKPARNMVEAKDLLVNSVWDTENSSVASVISELESLIRSFNSLSIQSSIRNIIIFCSKERLSEPAGHKICISLAQVLEEQGTKPVFIIVDQESEGFSNELPVFSETRKQNIIERLLIESEYNSLSSDYDARLFKSFLDASSSYNWQVIL